MVVVGSGRSGSPDGGDSCCGIESATTLDTGEVVVTEAASIGAPVTAMAVMVLGAPGRHVNSNRGSGGGDCVGKCYCRGLVKNGIFGHYDHFDSVYTSFVSTGRVKSNLMLICDIIFI